MSEIPTTYRANPQAPFVARIPPPSPELRTAEALETLAEVMRGVAEDLAYLRKATQVQLGEL